jgi:hypothetical protein
VALEDIRTRFSRTRTAEDIVQIFNDRRNARGPLIGAMERLQAHYNGEIIVPLPEMDRDEQSAVSNNIVTGVDAYGQRIASVTPMITCPPLNPRLKGSQDKADTRRKVYYGWWEQNKMGLILRQRARWLVGYASAPVVIKPDMTRGIPRWEERNPLTVYPAPSSRAWEMCPEDCIVAVTRTLREVKAMWPDKWRLVADPDTPLDTRFTILEYSDPELRASILLAPTDLYQTRAFRGHPGFVELAAVQNRIGMCNVVAPGRITLDRLAGQFDQLVGPYRMRAKLMAMELLAAEAGVFPDTYLVTRTRTGCRGSSPAPTRARPAW